MTTAALAFLLSATTFVAHDLPGLEVYAPNPLSGSRATNHRISDLDRDGNPDIVMPDRVYFQRNGAYSLLESLVLPDLSENPRGDIWHDELYLQLPNRIRSYRWESGRWQRLLDHEIEWPHGTFSPRTPEISESADRQAIEFGRFLADIDHDNIPEIVLINREGLHIYKRAGDVVFRANILDLLPALTIPTAAEGSRTSSPIGNYSIARSMSCRLLMESDSVRVITSQPALGNERRYTIHSYTLSQEGALGIDTEKSTEQHFPPIPDYMQPCRLNNDEVVDFAGTRFELSSASVSPTPLLTTTASLDGGKSVISIRTRSFRPQCSFIDMNGDGALDLITEDMSRSLRGPQGAIMAFLTQTSYKHEIRIHYQRNGTFSRRPDQTVATRIILEQPPVSGSPRAEAYRDGTLIDVTGDFNGDGMRDILVHDRPHQVSIYWGTSRGFSKPSRPPIEIPNDATVAAADIDGDGRSDIVIQTVGPTQSAPSSSTRVYFARSNNQ